MNRLGSLILVVCASGCTIDAQRTPGVASPMNSYTDIARCNVRVIFSGVSRELSKLELNQLSAQASKYYKWQISGYAYEEYRRQEMAICLCRDAPFTKPETMEIAARLTATSDSTLQPVFAADPPGESVYGLSRDEATNTPGRFRLLRPNGVDSCLLIQTLVPRWDQDKPSAFFAGVSSLPSAVEKSATPVTKNSSVAERLKQLQQLLDDKLITRSEYDQRRKAIVEQL